MSQIGEKKFINFWKFLGILINSPLAHIKLAYVKKFTEIEKSLDKGEKIYSANDLLIANEAYDILSNPYKRFLHNCEIDGEEPNLPDFDFNEIDEMDSEQDLSGEDNASFLAWLNSKMKEYYSAYKNNGISANNGISWNIELTVYKDIAIGLAKNHTNLLEQLEKKQTQKKKINK